MTEQPPSLPTRVEKWFTKTGYPLEIRIAQELARSGWEVAQSVGYVDPIERKDREADVLADVLGHSDDLPWQVTLVLECKNADADKPWVALTTEASLPSLSSRVVNEAFSTVRGQRENPPPKVLQRWDGCPIFEADLLATGVVTAFTAPNSKDMASAAVRQVLSATAAFDAEPARPITPKARIHIPMVITGGALLSCSLQPDTGDVTVETIDHCMVRAYRAGRATLVQVSTADYFISTISPAIGQLRG